MIIRPFNAAHLLLLALAAGAVVLLWVLLRGQPERCRSAVLIALCAANIIGFFVYKGFLSRDMQFLQASGLDRFNWFSELPMQLCNINMFLIPIGILTKRRSLLGLLMSDTSLEPLHALRLAAFNVISVISTTGYASQDFAQWPASIYILMFVVACFATCGGSTGGGMKMLRVVMLVKYTSLQLVTTAQPRVVRPMVLNGQVLADKTVLSALSFMLLWLATTVLAFLGLLLTGLDATTAFGAVLGCICNIGPGLGAVGPNANFSVLTDAQLWLCTFCMLIGRLELVTVFVLFTRSFWRA